MRINMGTDPVDPRRQLCTTRYQDRVERATWRWKITGNGVFEFKKAFQERPLQHIGDLEGQHSRIDKSTAAKETRLVV